MDASRPVTVWVAKVSYPPVADVGSSCHRRGIVSAWEKPMEKPE